MTTPNKKNKPRIINVHFNRSLNATFFSVGPTTSGKKLIIVSSAPIAIPQSKNNNNDL